MSALPTGFTTNLAARTITNRLHRLVAFTKMVVVTNVWVMATNLGRIFPASGTEFGPMAQDWHAATGLQDGHKISATSEAGLLIGAVQGLASLQNIFTNTAGARFALVVNAQTNGFVFVPQ